MARALRPSHNGCGVWKLNPQKLQATGQPMGFPMERRPLRSHAPRIHFSMARRLALATLLGGLCFLGSPRRVWRCAEGERHGLEKGKKSSRHRGVPRAWIASRRLGPSAPSARKLVPLTASWARA